MKSDLSKLNWSLVGWRPNVWHMFRSRELNDIMRSETAPVPVKIPGSVQQALREAGIISDWNQGLSSRDCEWVENRHWEFFTDLPADFVAAGNPVVLCADGLDYSGAIVIDKQIVARFQGALRRHKFDVSGYLGDGKAHRLAIIFDETPREQGQIGYSSRSRFFKPRYSYSWDWCPRLVPIGIWDQLWLQWGEEPLEMGEIRTSLAPDLSSGRLHIACQVPRSGLLQVSLSKPDGGQLSHEQELQAGSNEVSLPIAAPALWYPNGQGAQNLYDLEVRFDNETVHQSRIGFKRVEWRSNPGTGPAALPWLCVVNGQETFLAGVNWTPIDLDYHHIGTERYKKLIELYKEMGCNVLRVWGGAYLEREVFYRLCDEAGLLVWQEFPLSSSGLENIPPDNPQAIQDLQEIAQDYVRRRACHVSLMLWCGGNELFRDQAGVPRPCGLEEPAFAALAKVVSELDPERRFVPSSPSGPVFGAEERNFGKDIHHHVHGPWGMDGSLADWERYWSSDDSTFRSEVGLPGAAPANLIKTYAGTESAWPADSGNPLWLHSSAWWIQSERFKAELAGLDGEQALDTYCRLSQELQAKGLEIAAQKSKNRFPACGGFIVWMGHDCFPCPSNTSIIDYEGNPKPAYWALRRVFRPQA